MKNFEKLSEFELTSVKGGRVVTTYDLDGDGNWDVKCIVRNNGT
ncbi:hypothetical protein [Labilibaculum euxinus]